jgi:transposase
VAAAVLALLPPRLWGRAKAAAAYAGLIPKREESGKSLERSRLSRKGPLLRRQLFMGALVAVRHDPEIGAFYHRLLSRGKRNEQALVAVAHKLRFGAATPNEP